MKVKFTNAFEKDLSRIDNKKIAAAILEVIENVTALADLFNFINHSS
jgi:hypothetical protein